VNPILEEHGFALIKHGLSLYDLLKRPEINYELLSSIDTEKPDFHIDVFKQCEVQIKYDGYITKQLKQIEKFKALEKKYIKPNIPYSDIEGLRLEARQKLAEIKPSSIGQASRISGVSPADISVLLVYLEQQRRGAK
ncbi:MAG: tRNA uridine-5-carboxymethylaminomethyl(34) synthesis enzyme MnmG, partial [Acidaminobacteraceae bacterium]